jgi:hypothetical protein
MGFVKNWHSEILTLLSGIFLSLLSYLFSDLGELQCNKSAFVN